MMSENLFNQPQVPQPLALFRAALLNGWLHKLWARLSRQCFCLEELGAIYCISDGHHASGCGIRSATHPWMLRSP